MVKVSGRIIIDEYAYYRYKSLIKLIDFENASVEDESQDESEYEFEKGPPNKRIKQLVDVERNENLSPFSDIECILAVPQVKGFDLRSKECCIV